MKQLKKYFETREGRDEFEFQQIGWFMPLMAVLVICYVIYQIICFFLEKPTVFWEDIVAVCFMILSMIGVLSMIFLLYSRLKKNQTFTRKNIGLIRLIGLGLIMFEAALAFVAMDKILSDPLLMGNVVLVYLLVLLIDAMANIMVRGEKIQKEQDLTI
jgi:hypothetical protein